jgi:FMN phosphatase YigB (HAD superfamily)
VKFVLKSSNLIELSGGDWKHVSFDVFDTLLIREFVTPRGSLLFATQKFRLRTPIWWRISVEHAFRVSNGLLQRGRETNYRQISKLVPSNFITMEKKAEALVVSARPSGLKLLNDAQALGATISFISDTTFTSNEVRDLLLNSGIPVVGPIFVSSEFSATKREGQLFDIVQENLNLDPASWLHIGDDSQADVLSPAARGISTLEISKQVDILVEKIHHDQLTQLLNSNSLCSLLTLGIFCNEVENNKRFSDDNYYRIGLSVIGPLLSGFADWISSETKAADRVTFLGRDGYLPKQVFDLIHPNGTRSKYSRVSRRKLLVPAWLGKLNSPEDFVRRMPKQSNETSMAYFTRLGLVRPVFLNEENSEFISLPDILESEEVRKQAIEEEVEIASLISNLSKADVIVDVGWRATLQEAIQILSGRKIQGLYLGTSISTFISAPGAKGWLTNSGRPRKHAKIIRQSIGFIEKAFSEQVPSQLGGNAEQLDFLIDSKVSSMQDGALDFAKLWIAKSKTYQLTMNSSTAVSGLGPTMLKPSSDDLNLVGDIGNQHFPSIKFQVSETLIPEVSKGMKCIGDYPTPAESGANWPIGYEKRIIEVLKSSGFKTTKSQIFVWRFRSIRFLLKSTNIRKLITSKLIKIS